MQPNVQQTRRAPLSLGPVEFATFGLNTWESGQQKEHDFRIGFASLPSSAKSFVLEKLYAPSKYKGPICQTRNIKQENFTLDTSNEPKRPLPHIETHPEPNLYLIPIAAHRAVESLPIPLSRTTLLLSTNAQCALPETTAIVHSYIHAFERTTFQSKADERNADDRKK